MIFGKTEFKIAEEHREKNCFAWLPVLLADGRIAWFESLYREKWTFDKFSGYSYYEPRIDLVVADWRIQK
jgi:hypothetical protein